MSLDRTYLSAFAPRRPAHASSQVHGVEWLTAAHTRAEGVARAARGEEFDAEAFASQMRKFIQRFGCSPEKIASRGHALEDFNHFDWERMRIFDVTRQPHGADLAARNSFFREAAEDAFEAWYANGSGSDPHPPDEIIHVSCTGYVSPSAAQSAVVRMGWQERTQVTHAYHMGCYAAIPALRMARGFLAAEPGRRTRVDIAHTELCTLHFDPLKHAPEQLVVQSLFADGFIRYGVTRTPAARAQPGAPSGFEIVSLREEMVPGSRDAMTWDLSPWGFAMTLSRDVPSLIAGALPGFLERLCTEAGLSFADERARAVFAVHPGGPKIIEKVAELLELSTSQTAFSERVLASCGNMSSATLPHIWDLVSRDAAVPEGTLVVSLAFGPGLSICGALLRKTP